MPTLQYPHNNKIHTQKSEKKNLSKRFYLLLKNHHILSLVISAFAVKQKNAFVRFFLSLQLILSLFKAIKALRTGKKNVEIYQYSHVFIVFIQHFLR